MPPSFLHFPLDLHVTKFLDPAFSSAGLSFVTKDRSQNTLTRFWLFLTTYFLRLHSLPYKYFFYYLPTSPCKRSFWTTPYTMNAFLKLPQFKYIPFLEVCTWMTDYLSLWLKPDFSNLWPPNFISESFHLSKRFR